MSLKIFVRFLQYLSILLVLRPYYIIVCLEFLPHGGDYLTLLIDISFPHWEI